VRRSLPVGVFGHALAGINRDRIAVGDTDNLARERLRVVSLGDPGGFYRVITSVAGRCKVFVPVSFESLPPMPNDIPAFERGA
jgi:hypothetical protein